MGGARKAAETSAQLAVAFNALCGREVERTHLQYQKNCPHSRSQDKNPRPTWLHGRQKKTECSFWDKVPYQICSPELGEALSFPYGAFAKGSFLWNICLSPTEDLREREDENPTGQSTNIAAQFGSSCAAHVGGEALIKQVLGLCCPSAVCRGAREVSETSAQPTASCLSVGCFQASRQLRHERV